MSREGAPLRIEGTGAKYGEWVKNELISLKLKAKALREYAKPRAICHCLRENTLSRPVVVQDQGQAPF